MKTKTSTAICALAFAGLGSLALFAQPVRKPNQARDFMRLKLEHSQKLLEAIALEDFEEISRNAQKIALLTEDENWKVMQTVDYRRHSDDFRRTANAVTEAARKKNLDGSVLAYVQMTMQCVHCHQHVRGEKRPAEKAK